MNALVFHRGNNPNRLLKLLSGFGLGTRQYFCCGAGTKFRSLILGNEKPGMTAAGLIASIDLNANAGQSIKGERGCRFTFEHPHPEP